MQIKGRIFHASDLYACTTFPKKDLFFPLFRIINKASYKNPFGLCEREIPGKYIPLTPQQHKY